MNAELAASKIEDDNYVKDVPYILTTCHQQMHLDNSSSVFQVVIKFALSLDIILRCAMSHSQLQSTAFTIESDFSQIFSF